MYMAFRDLFKDGNKGTFMVFNTHTGKELIVSPCKFGNGKRGLRFRLYNYNGDLNDNRINNLTAYDLTTPNSNAIANGYAMNYTITELRKTSDFTFNHLYSFSYDLLHHLFNTQIFQERNNLFGLLSKRDKLASKLTDISDEIEDTSRAILFATKETSGE